MWKIALGRRIVSGLAGCVLPVMLETSGVAVGDESTQSIVRAGGGIALDSCTGCHVVSQHQPIQAGQRRGIRSFEEIANSADATANILLKKFNDTHRNKDAPQATSIFATTYISDLETSEVIAYLLTQRHRP